MVSYLSRILDNSNYSKSSKLLFKNLYFCTVIITAVTTCSVYADSSKNDSDGDSLRDAYEIKIGTESYLSDTDGDTIRDDQEVGVNLDKPLDTDADGVINALDYDDDNDGLPSYLESKQDSDNDGLLDYLDPDSDNDGIADGEEAGFLNQDKNLDGIDDAFDSSRDGAVDTNGDGIDDNVELPDHNRDGKPDYLDAKFQHQKQILVKKEIPKKKATVVAEKKSKSEKALKKEAKQVVKKTIENSKPKLAKAEDMIINRHTDSDNDGLSNALEKSLGTNHLSRDSDNDKVSDAIEIGLDVNSPQDSDRDGIIDALDEDDDNDGVLTRLEDLNQDSTAINDDTDADGVPNYLDANDDGDNLLTKEESIVTDSDGDGILDYLDKSDNVKGQANASNTMKVKKDNDTVKNPEIVVLFDGNEEELMDEEDDAIGDLAEISAQDKLLNSLESTLQQSDLNVENKNLSSDEEVNKIQTATSPKKAKSQWELF